MSLEAVHEQGLVQQLRNVPHLRGRVVHRKLNMRRNEKFMQEVERFVASNIGKQYKFSLR